MTRIDDGCDGRNHSDNCGRDTRRRRTLRNQESGAHHSNGYSNNLDNGKLDLSNIVLGKRKRNLVNYIKLNDALFGDVSEKELAKIDDANDDFEVPSMSSKLRKHRSSSCSSSLATGQSERTDSSAEHDNYNVADGEDRVGDASNNRSRTSRSNYNSLTGSSQGATATKKMKSSLPATRSATRPRSSAPSTVSRTEKDWVGRRTVITTEKDRAGRRSALLTVKPDTTKDEMGSAYRLRVKAARRSFQRDRKPLAASKKSRSSSPPNGRTLNSSPVQSRNQKNRKSKM